MWEFFCFVLLTNKYILLVSKIVLIVLFTEFYPTSPTPAWRRRLRFKSNFRRISLRNEDYCSTRLLLFRFYLKDMIFTIQTEYLYWRSDSLRTYMDRTHDPLLKSDRLSNHKPYLDYVLTTNVPCWSQVTNALLR